MALAPINLLWQTSRMGKPPKLELEIKAWLKRHSSTVRVGRWIARILLIPLSVTWVIAGAAKAYRPRDRSYRSKVIVAFNLAYLGIALCTACWLILLLGNDPARLRASSGLSFSLWAWFLWSRCAEVLIAFYRDALDRLRGRESGSDLNGPWRVVLALNSYLELVIVYGLLYAIMPKTMWSEAPVKITDALWVSASTITTSGSAGLTIKHWLPQFFSTLEIFSGVILLVVCFTLYSGGENVQSSGEGSN